MNAMASQITSLTIAQIKENIKTPRHRPFVPKGRIDNKPALV